MLGVLTVMRAAKQYHLYLENVTAAGFNAKNKTIHAKLRTQLQHVLRCSSLGTFLVVDGKSRWYAMVPVFGMVILPNDIRFRGLFLFPPGGPARPSAAHTRHTCECSSCSTITDIKPATHPDT